MTWQRRYEGVAKNAAFDLFVAFFHSLRKKKKTKRRDDGKKLCATGSRVSEEKSQCQVRVTRSEAA